MRNRVGGRAGAEAAAPIGARVREQRRREEKRQRLGVLVAASAAALLVACVYYAASQADAGASARSRADARRRKLRQAADYGFAAPAAGGAAVPPAAAAGPCPLAGCEGLSALECFFQDLVEEVKLESGLVATSDPKLGAEGTYGEITPAGVHVILQALSVTEGDGFYDLGSGFGKVVLQALLTTGCSRAVGVELSEDRHNSAELARGKVLSLFSRGDGALSEALASRLEFRHGDATTTALGDATVVFMCSLCFPAFVMEGIAQHILAAAAPGVVVLTLKPFQGCHPGLVLIGHLALPMTWTESFDMLVYVVAPPPAVFLGLLRPGAAVSRGPPTRAWRAVLAGDMGTREVAAAAADLASRSAVGRGLVSVEALQHALDQLAPGATSPALVRRFARVVAARASTSAKSLALEALQRERALALPADSPAWVGERSAVNATEAAHWIFSRVRGDDDTALDCVLVDLWPRPLPKLRDEEQRAAFGRLSSAQLQVTPPLFGEVLGLLEPPAGPPDVLVEASSGAGQLVIQARLTTSVGRAVGVEAVPSLHELALEAEKRLRACAGGAADVGCPHALPRLPTWDGAALDDEELHFALSDDPVGAAAGWPGATAVYALSIGWPPGATWRLQAVAASALPAGAMLLTDFRTAPGCARGFLEVTATSLAGNKSLRHGFPMMGAISGLVKVPIIDPAHPLFASSGETTETLKELLIKRLGADPAAPGWRDRPVPLDRAVEMLVDPGPPFLPARAGEAHAPGAGVMLRGRLRAMLRRHAAGKARFKRPDQAVGEDEIALWDLMGVLSLGLEGKAQSPLGCLAADLHALSREADVGAGRRSAAADMGLLLGPAAVGLLWGEGSRLGGRLAGDAAGGGLVLVLGDCRAAALALVLAPRALRARCLPALSVSGAGGAAATRGPRYDLAAQELARHHPSALSGRTLEQPPLQDSVAALWTQEAHWQGASAVLVAARQAPDVAVGGKGAARATAAALGALAGALPRLLARGALLASLAELEGFGLQGLRRLPGDVQLPQAWERDRAPAVAFFYESP